jgi:hypothetical protein
LVGDLLGTAIAATMIEAAEPFPGISRNIKEPDCVSGGRTPPVFCQLVSQADLTARNNDSTPRRSPTEKAIATDLSRVYLMEGGNNILPISRHGGDHLTRFGAVEIPDYLLCASAWHWPGVPRRVFAPHRGRRRFANRRIKTTAVIS